MLEQNIIKLSNLKLPTSIVAFEFACIRMDIL